MATKMVKLETASGEKLTLPMEAGDQSVELRPSKNIPPNRIQGIYCYIPSEYFARYDPGNEKHFYFARRGEREGLYGALGYRHVLYADFFPTDSPLPPLFANEGGHIRNGDLILMETSQARYRELVEQDDEVNARRSRQVKNAYKSLGSNLGVQVTEG